MTNPRTCIGYIRVSTQGQADEGVSLEAQREKIQQWAALKGYTLTAVFQDAGISGTSMKGRPGLALALAASTEGTSLVAYSISRLARSTIDMAVIVDRLRTQKAELVSIIESIDTNSATGRMLFGMVTTLAQFESELLSERTKVGMDKAKRDGAKFGSPNPRAGGAVNSVRCAARAAAKKQGLTEAQVDAAGLAAVAQLRAEREAAKVAP